MHQQKEEIVEVSFVTKFLDGAARQGFQTLLLVAVTAWYLLVDRPETKAELRECNASYVALYKLIVDRDDEIINKNTQSLADMNRTIKNYFHKQSQIEIE